MLPALRPAPAPARQALHDSKGTERPSLLDKSGYVLTECARHDIARNFPVLNGSMEQFCNHKIRILTPHRRHTSTAGCGYCATIKALFTNRRRT